jgi:hypothetical protein
MNADSAGNADIAVTAGKQHRRRRHGGQRALWRILENAKRASSIRDSYSVGGDVGTAGGDGVFTAVLGETPGQNIGKGL